LQSASNLTFNRIIGADNKVCCQDLEDKNLFINVSYYRLNNPTIQQSNENFVVEDMVLPLASSALISTHTTIKMDIKASLSCFHLQTDPYKVKLESSAFSHDIPRVSLSTCSTDNITLQSDSIGHNTKSGCTLNQDFYDSQAFDLLAVASASPMACSAQGRKVRFACIHEIFIMCLLF
jgi:hypothetical protein